MLRIVHHQVEDQTRAAERIPDLLATSAAVRFISAEPLLGPVDLTEISATSDGLTCAFIPFLVSRGTSGTASSPDQDTIPASTG